MRVKLVSHEWQSRSEILLDRFPVTLGRGPAAGVQLDDRWVSHQHCQLDAVDGTLVVRDLGSKHGTLINGCYAEQSPLEPGDRLSVGLSTFIVAYERRADV
jgi:pSer/pThr/pTyr-binding forkhead associated (FHA) protein